MSARHGRRLIAAALLIVVLVAVGVGPSFAGGPSGPTCCLCQCQGLPTQCFAAGSDLGCSPFLNQCEQAAGNTTCRAGFIPGNCTDVGCASIGIPAAAPTLDVTGLAAGVIVLSGLAALRLRRLAKQRSRSR